MRGSLTGFKKIGGGIVELALGALVVGLLIAALHPSTTKANAEPKASALQQIPAGTICIVDDSNGNQLQFDPTTGAYTFTSCKGSAPPLTGTGLVKIKGCQVTLTHIAADRRVTANVDFCAQKGKASAQTFTPALTRTIQDRNTADDVCGCAAAAPAVPTRGTANQD